MKRITKSKDFIYFIYFFFLGFLLVAANITLMIQNRKYFQILEEKPYDIVVANVSTNQVEVYWKTKTKNLEVLAYKEKEGTTPYRYEKNFRMYTDISNGEDLYKSTISNLTPNTQYVFRIHTPEHIWDNDFTFRTKDIGEQVKLPQIETGNANSGDFVLIDAEGEKYMIFANRNKNWALDLKGKSYKETKYAQYTPKFELKRRLNAALKNSVYAATGANCMTNVIIKDNSYLPTLEQSLALTEGGRFSYCKGDYLRECYADTYCKSVQEGVNPALTLTIWMHESAASMYAKFPVVEDFGIHGKGLENDFTGQINYFLNNIAVKSYTNDWFDIACKKRLEMSDEEINNLKEKYTEEQIWATKYWKGYVCTEDIDGIGAGVQYITELNEMYIQMTGQDFPKWSKWWGISANSNSCDYSQAFENTIYRTCSGETTDTIDCSSNPPGKTDIRIGQKCSDGGGCECFDGEFVSENYLKDVPCGEICTAENPDEGKTVLEITNKDLPCNDSKGCVCYWDNRKVRKEANKGQICKTDQTIIDNPDIDKVILEVTDKDMYCRSSKGCVCYWDNRKVRKEAVDGETCTVDKEVIQTEGICCYNNNYLIVKMPYDCTGVIRNDIPITSCQSVDTTYELKKGVSFINPVEALDNTEVLYPKTAYDLVNMSDNKVITVGEYKSGEWIQIVKYEDGKIYGNDFKLDSNKSYMVVSLQEAEFNVSGYRLPTPDILKLSGWNLVPSYVFYNKGSTSFDILKNLEFNKIRQMGQWQDYKGLFDYTIKDDDNNIFGEEIEIKDQEGIFIKVLQ